MSTAGAFTRPSGSFGVVGPAIGQKQRRELVDEDALTEKEKEALEADDFIIYGKASVETYDDDTPSQKLEMEAFEPQMESFLNDGVISRRHKDIKVGQPLSSYTLEQPVDIAVGDEVYSYEAGDVLETGIRDDELWIVANIKNDSELARDTRRGILQGELDGFSVTVFCKEWENTSKGQRVTDLEWHSVTIGADEQIKNRESRFDLAEFKGDFPDLGPQEAKAVEEILAHVKTMSNEESETEKGLWERVADIASQKANGEAETKSEDEEEESEDEKEFDAEEELDDTPDELDEMGDEKAGEDEEDDTDDLDRVMEKVRAELGDDEADTIEKAMDAPTPPDPPEDDEEDDEEYEGEGELKAEDLKAELSEAFVTEEKLDERLSSIEEKLDSAVTAEAIEEKLNERLPEGDVASKADVEDVIKAASDVLSEEVPAIVEGTAEKMHTAGTPSPASGSTQDVRDYQSEIQERFGSGGKE